MLTSSKNKRSLYQPYFIIKVRRFLLPLLLFLLIFPKIFGQDNKKLLQELDSLKLLHLHETNDTFKLKYYTLIGRFYRYINIDSSKVYLRKAIQLHKDQNLNKEIHAYAYNVIADIYRLEENVDSANFYYEEAYQLFKEETAPFLAIAPTYGSFLVENKEPQKGIEIVEKAIRLAIEENDFHDLSYLYESLGNIFLEVQKDSYRAKNIFSKGLLTSLKMNDEVNYKRVNSGLNLGLAKIYMQEMKNDSATIYAAKALRLSLDVNYIQKALIAANVLCESYLNLGQLDQAKKFNQKAYELFSNVKGIQYIIKTKILKVAILLKSNQYKQSTILGKAILAEYSENLTNETKEKIYKYLFDAKIKSGNVSDILNIKDSLIFYSQQNYNQDRNFLLAKMYDEIQIQEQKLQAQNIILQKELKNQQLDLENKDQKIKFGLISFLGLAFFFFIFYHLKKRHMNRMKLFREKVIDDLHDSMGYNLNSIIRIAKGLKKIQNAEKINPQFDRLIGQGYEALHNVLDIIWSFDDIENKLEDLIEKMESYLDIVRTNNQGIKIEFIKNNLDQDTLINLDTKYNLLMVFKEALNNIQKHTNSSVIKVEVNNYKPEFELNILNQFESKIKSTSSSGRGIPNLKKRIHDLGGQIIIKEEKKYFEIRITLKNI